MVIPRSWTQRIGLALAALASVSACVHPPDPPVIPAAAAAPSADFQLGRGDIVRLSVWREKDLTCEPLDIEPSGTREPGCKVDEQGRLTLPMLGVVSVLNRPWSRLRDSLVAEFQRQLKNPSVTLIPYRRVQVLGEVTNPGQYFADPTTSLAGVIALAGGATPIGDLRRVRVVRNGQILIRRASVESLLLQADVQSNDQVFVDRRGWVERNGSVIASTIISTAGIVVALIRR
jgi:polysaccharide export outer membrane protein